MNLKARLRRTAQGEDELLTRCRRLDHQLRLMLILVDGTSTVEQVMAKAEGRPDALELLQRLRQEGYLMVEEAARPGASGVKGELMKIARELLGADAAKVVGRLEAAPDTREGLLEATAQCRKIIRLTIDEKKSEQLMARCHALLDSL